MIILFGHQVEIYQAILLTYVIGWGVVYGVRNTFARFVSLFTGVYNQSNLGVLLDALWYGCIFILVGTLV
tara:strand:+ start:441 stop:650 length:210 start_codon:yes stop_codon:yes gene_type:complete